MTELKLVVNGIEYASLHEVPDALKRPVALVLGSMKLTAAQLRGQARIHVNLSAPVRADEPTYELEPDRTGPMLGTGDPSPFSKTFLALTAATLAALAVLKAC